MQKNICKKGHNYSNFRIQYVKHNKKVIYIFMVKLAIEAKHFQN